MYVFHCILFVLCEGCSSANEYNKNRRTFVLRPVQINVIDGSAEHIHNDMQGYIYCVPSACITNSSFEYYNEIHVLFGSVVKDEF
jgi:hypothetical protein